ncbi:hypothetical protein [Streptomyces coeruleofuscus]|uniref:Uncharacterized protein n=1 Tax=Streptomyces coeruleofuscus TaxID=66879 RepID=A0ABP5UT98_9ACTN
MDEPSSGVVRLRRPTVGSTPEDGLRTPPHTHAPASGRPQRRRATPRSTGPFPAGAPSSSPAERPPGADVPSPAAPPPSLTEVEAHGVDRIPDAERTATPLDLFRLAFGGANTFFTGPDRRGAGADDYRPGAEGALSGPSAKLPA